MTTSQICLLLIPTKKRTDPPHPHHPPPFSSFSPHTGKTFTHGDAPCPHLQCLPRTMQDSALKGTPHSSNSNCHLSCSFPQPRLFFPSDSSVMCSHRLCMHLHSDATRSYFALPTKPIPPSLLTPQCHYLLVDMRQKCAALKTCRIASARRDYPPKSPSNDCHTNCASFPI